MDVYLNAWASEFYRTGGGSAHVPSSAGRYTYYVCFVDDLSFFSQNLIVTNILYYIEEDIDAKHIWFINKFVRFVYIISIFNISKKSKKGLSLFFLFLYVILSAL
jgi:hypothetical protein